MKIRDATKAAKGKKTTGREREREREMNNLYFKVFAPVY
jgi:hypothetical protein